MSGIEAAGLILAAFPLLISALEHYRESAGALENWWEIKREYRKCKREIEHQKLRFEGALEEFLLPLIVDDEALKALIEDPGGMLWKNPRLEEALQERLPKSYDLYLETVQEINDVMNGLKRELGLDKVHFQKELEVEAADKSDSNSRSKQNKTARKANLEFQTQRIRFALGESSRNKLFNELAHYNQRLRDLLETHDRLTALRSTGEKRRTEISCRVLSQFWRHASTLYTLLARAWCCECETSHHANLLLQHRTTSAAEFKILFLSSKAASNPGPGAWKCQETHFKLLTDETPSSEIASPTSASLQTALTKAPNKKSNKANFFRSSLMGQREKPSNVDKPTDDNSNLPPASRMVKPKITWLDAEACSATPASAHDDRSVITDLCTSIAAYRPGLSCFGLLKDDDACYTVYPLTKLHTTLDPHDTVTLQMLLDKDFEISLNRRQRFSIALTLASSHLQLYSTPWLSAQWSKKDVVFLRDDEAPASVIADQPYISHGFSTKVPPTAAIDVHRDRSISNLGIMLLELCFGVALEDHNKLRQVFVPSNGQSNPYLDLAMAQEWCKCVEYEAGPLFASAIQCCLQMNSVDVKSKEGREKLFTEVVEPLLHCHNFMNERPGHL